MNCVELLSRLIEIPSVSREEKAVADYLEQILAPYDVKRIGNNLYMMQPHYDAGKKTLLLNAHIDTVKPVSGWQREPYKATGYMDWEVMTVVAAW